MEAMHWPDGKRAAAAFTFDLDAEAVWLGFDPANANRPGVLSQGTYGPRVGLPLILERLARFEVRATFFIPGVNAEVHPAAVESIVAAGHEVAVHGYRHVAPASLSRVEEARELELAMAALGKIAGSLAGYRSPSWDVSPHTLDLVEAAGLTYTSQFMDDLRPYRHPGRRLIELPVHWVLDDWPNFMWSADQGTRTIRSVEEVEPIWRAEFEGIRDLGGLFVLTMHPQIIGRPYRLLLLEHMLELAASSADVWTATCREAADYADGQLAAEPTSHG
jgi:peptidoglycan/xylan/chitin deacetylase (PgdA/CDA1 family)